MTDFLVFKIESVSVDALGVWLVIAVDITVPAVVVFSQSLSVGFGDAAATMDAGFDIWGVEITNFCGFELKPVVVNAQGLSIAVVSNVLALATVFFLESTVVGFGDVAATSCGVLDDVSSKLVAGGSLWVLASCVGVGGLVWVPVSSLGVFRGRGGSRSSVWMPFVSRTAATVKHWGPCPAAVHSARSSVLPIANNDVYAFFVRSSSSSRPFRYPSSQLVSTFFFHSL